MSSAAFIIGVIFLGVLIIGAAFVVAGAFAANGKSDEGEQAVLRQPEMKYFNDYEAADYLCLSLAELNSMREKGLLAGTFITLRTVDDGAAEQFYDFDEDGNEIINSRPSRRDAIRYIYSLEALDKKMAKLMSEGDSIDVR